jgi:hypothetical protein
MPPTIFQNLKENVGFETLPPPDISLPIGRFHSTEEKVQG